MFVSFFFSSQKPLSTFFNLTQLEFNIICMLPPYSSIVPLFNILHFRVKHNQLVIAHAKIFYRLSALIDHLTEPILNALSAFFDYFNYCLKIRLFLALKLKIFLKSNNFVFQKGDFWLFCEAKMINNCWLIEKSLFIPCFLLISHPCHVCSVQLHDIGLLGRRPTILHNPLCRSFQKVLELSQCLIWLLSDNWLTLPCLFAQRFYLNKTLLLSLSVEIRHRSH